jgi:hypothetical protein
MKFFEQLLKLAAVLCSFSLMGCYVYNRSGGNLSKSALESNVKTAEVSSDESKPVLLPGSKSFPVGFQEY